jgi:hypothetical protein
LDASFQMMILWCFEFEGAGSLPTGAARYRQYRRDFPADGTQIAIRIVGAAEHAAEAEIEYLDSQGNLVARMDGYECVIDYSLLEAFARNQLPEEVQS